MKSELFVSGNLKQEWLWSLDNFRMLLSLLALRNIKLRTEGLLIVVSVGGRSANSLGETGIVANTDNVRMSRFSY